MEKKLPDQVHEYKNLADTEMTAYEVLDLQNLKNCKHLGWHLESIIWHTHGRAKVFNFGGDVAAFVSIHQTLIPKSALIDGLWLCESHSPFRPTALLMFAGGIVMIIANG